MLVFTESNESVDLNRCIGTRSGETQYKVNKYHTHFNLKLYKHVCIVHLFAHDPITESSQQI